MEQLLTWDEFNSQFKRILKTRAVELDDALDRLKSRPKSKDLFRRIEWVSKTKASNLYWQTLLPIKPRIKYFN